MTTNATTLLIPSQYPTIQAGIAASSNGDTVLVSPGTYIENINFQGKSITVKSEQGAESTRIDGNQAGSTVMFDSGENENSILEGFTVTNGLGGGSYPNYTGGGITCKNSSDPIITNNIITRNSATTAGGGIASLDYSEPIITNNIITMNIADDGGGIYGDDSFLTIVGNTICENVATFYGGGIYAYYTGAIVRNNVIKGNTATYKGGGMGVLEATHTSYPIWDIVNNVIADNSAGTGAGGISIQCNFPAPGHNITNNTITGNSAESGGAIGLYLSAYPVITNTILWDNSAPEIYVSEGGGAATVNYSDVMGGCPGTGNIDDDPLFVYPDQNDYRLRWGSPCIDLGDPNPIYTDPDGTRADMGAFHYDQSIPVRILLTPHNTPIQIPAGGGSFDYTIWATNIDPVSQLVNIWCDATLPDGSIYGPVLGPASVTLDSGITLSRERTQTVPAGIPTGTYFYNSYGVAGADTSTDSFAFGKLGSGELNGYSGWLNSGEPFNEVYQGDSRIAPTRFALIGAYPNPFNPSTVISYQLSVVSQVSLEIYDISGRLISTPLHHVWRDAGVHEVTFDGSKLASGLYFYRIEVGDFSAIGKMVLIK
jgi:hypothetical protein